MTYSGNLGGDRFGNLPQHLLSRFSEIQTCVDGVHCSANLKAQVSPKLPDHLPEYNPDVTMVANEEPVKAVIRMKSQ